MWTLEFGETFHSLEQAKEKCTWVTVAKIYRYWKLSDKNASYSKKQVLSPCQESCPSITYEADLERSDYGLFWIQSYSYPLL